LTYVTYYLYPVNQEEKNGYGVLLVT